MTAHLVFLKLHGKMLPVHRENHRQIPVLDPYTIYKKIVHPLLHQDKQINLGLIQSLDILEKKRISMINLFRGSVKVFGSHLPQCSADSFHKQAKLEMPSKLHSTLFPVMDIIEQLMKQIKTFDQQVEQISQEKHPETGLLREIKGVGPLTALAFVLTLEDPARFSRSRQVGCFVGQTPRRDQSGELDKRLHITKAGSSLLRRLSVNGAQYILRLFGEDCNLRRFCLRLAGRGGKNAKRRAVVAVARKLAVLMHRLWQHGEMYIPLYKPRNHSLAMAA